MPPACSLRCFTGRSQVPPLRAQVLNVPVPTAHLSLPSPAHVWGGAPLRCLLKPGDTDPAVGGPQLDGSGEQHGGGGACAGLRSHPQRGDKRETGWGTVGPGWRPPIPFPQSSVPIPVGWSHSRGDGESQECKALLSCWSGQATPPMPSKSDCHTAAAGRALPQPRDDTKVAAGLQPCSRAQDRAQTATQASGAGVTY